MYIIEENKNKFEIKIKIEQMYCLDELQMSLGVFLSKKMKR